MFSFQKLFAHLYLRQSRAVLIELQKLTRSHLRFGRIDKSLPEMYFFDSDPKALPGVYSFSKLFDLLLHYDMQRAALYVVKRTWIITEKNAYFCLERTLHFRMLLLFRLIAKVVLAHIPAIGVSVLLNQALKTATHKEIEFILQTFSDTQPVILGLKNPAQLHLLQQYIQINIPPIILLTSFQDFDEDALLRFLQQSPQLLWQMREHDHKAEIVPDNNHMLGGLIHMALYYKRLRLVKYLLANQFSIDAPFTITRQSAHIDSLNFTKPAYYLARDLKTFLSIYESSTIEPPAFVYLNYCKALILGELVEISSSIYTAALKKEERTFRFIANRIEQFMERYSDAIEIIDLLLKQGNPHANNEIQTAFDQSAFGIIILRMAFEKKLQHIFRHVLAIKKYHTLEVIRFAATYHDLQFYDYLLIQIIQKKNGVNTLLSLARGLLATALTPQMLTLVDAAFPLLSENEEFRELLASIKNPLVQKRCIELGMSFNPFSLAHTAGFAIMTGDIVTAQWFLSHSSFDSDKRLQNYFASIAHDMVNTINPITDFSANRFDSSYGYGITQTQYKSAQGYQANLAQFYLRTYSINIISNFHPNAEMDNGGFGLSFFGMLRRQIAYFSRTGRAKFFGRLRYGTLYSPLCDDYQPYFDKFHERYYLQPPQNVVRQGYAIEAEHGLYFKALVTTTVQNKEVGITRYTTTDAKKPCWLHASAKGLDDLQPEINRLIYELMRSKLMADVPADFDEIVKKVAVIHWFMAHSCAHFRGSAHISEVLCAGLLMVKGILPVISGAPDCEALASANRDDYAREYKGFFKSLKVMSPVHDAACNVIVGVMSILY